MTSPQRTPALGPVERQSIRMTVTTLERKAAASESVVISARLALVIAKWLRQKLEGRD